MKQTIKKILEKHKCRLENKIINYHSSQSKSLILRMIDVIFWGMIFKQYYAVERIIRRFQRVLICAGYFRECDDNSPYANFLKKLMENRTKLRPLYYKKNDGASLLFFYSDKLGKLLNEFQEDKEMFVIAEKVANGKVHRCLGCGSGIVGPFPYTYRDNNGCVGKSYECYVCRQYDNLGLHNILEHRKKHGTVKTLLKAVNTGF